MAGTTKTIFWIISNQVLENKNMGLLYSCVGKFKQHGMFYIERILTFYNLDIIRSKYWEKEVYLGFFALWQHPDND